MIFSKRISKFLRSRWFLYAILAISVVIFINLKMLLIKDCFPFDSNDDANLTFPKLFVAFNHILNGELPLINLFDNFGTPLLGDSLTLPFSPHSLTYLFFPGYIAMAINRSLIAFLTIILLIKYFRKIFSLFTSSICTLLVFFSPSFFWAFAHHHFQMSLLDTVILLLLQIRYTKQHNILNLSYLFLGFILLFLSTSINLVFISTPFLLINQWFVSKKYSSTFINDFLLLGLAMISGFLFCYPQTIYFFKLLKISTRIKYNFGLPYTPLEFIWRIFGSINSGHNLWRHHLDAAIFFSFSLLAAIFLGLKFFIKEGIRKNIVAKQSMLLGVIPLSLFTVVFPANLVENTSGKIYRYLSSVVGISYFSNVFCRKVLR